jgi:chromosome segregation protein
MYLKRIELEGFKSFADRTVVPLQRGLTGIVGPNGCGKSNVVDALLWVLGERSAKTLRADAMEDVIFKGAEGRSAAPYAMVEIILGDDKGEIAEPGGEVAVGRRLFRTGESEFLLNGRKVRRKDVREVLMDTGLGVRGYMVLAQGKIDAVLAANPAERRSVFEEAAGISRYKERKKETERKLKAVGQDLSRVDDVLEEVQKAVRSLRYQAGKARRFVEMRDRYRELRVRVGMADRSALAEQESQLHQQADELDEKLKGLRLARSEAEQRLGLLEQEEGTLRDRHDALRSDLSDNKERIAGLEERVRGLETRAVESDQRHDKDQGRLASLLQAEQERAEEESSLQRDLDDVARQREAVEESLKNAEEVFAEAKRQNRALRECMEQMRRGVLEALSERTRFHNEVANATRRRSEAEGGLQARNSRQEELGKEAQQLAWDHEAADKVAQDARQNVIRLESQSMKLVEKQTHLRGEAQGYADVAGQARRKAATAKARLEALAGVEQDLQGVPAHVRKALEAEANGVRGMLLAEIRVAAPWDRILEDLLGRAQSALWLDSVEALGSLEGGAIDVFYPPKGGDGSKPEAIAGATLLSERLQGKATCIDALCAKLGTIYTVDENAQARQLAAQHPGRCFLSAEGELHGHGYSRLGMLTDDSAGMLARRNARDVAASQLEEADAEFERVSKREDDVNRRLEEVGEKLAEVEAQKREALSDREKAESRLQELISRKKRSSEELKALEREIDQLSKVVASASEKERLASEGRDAAEARRIKLNQELEEVQARAEAEGQDFERSSSQLQEARVEANRVKQGEELLNSKLRDSRRRAAKEAAEVGDLNSELNELTSRATDLRQEAEDAVQERTDLLEARGALAERLKEADTQLRRASQALVLEKDKRSGEAESLDTVMERRQDLALEVQKAQMTSSSLVQGLFEEFGQPLEDLAQSMDIDASAPLVDFEGEDVREEVHALKIKIDNIGAVNLDAVKELEEREERESFLTRERDDLLEARQNLEITLAELDELCSSRFVETFEAVQANFEHIFRRLFRGGRASLELTPNEDPLDAGIEIQVRPPGKELRSINLLSGGERTLTALALLLAVFQSRPSPFCLLDEVDAALDDANVERFIDAVKHFTGETQFVVVTHNRITMSRCERLFGVTMRKRGVSMVVSVELNEIPEAPGQDMALEGTPVERNVPTPEALPQPARIQIPQTPTDVS